MRVNLIEFELEFECDGFVVEEEIEVFEHFVGSEMKVEKPNFNANWYKIFFTLYFWCQHGF